MTMMDVGDDHGGLGVRIGNDDSSDDDVGDLTFGFLHASADTLIL